MVSVVIGVVGIITKRYALSVSWTLGTSPVQSVFQGLETLLLGCHVVHDTFLDLTRIILLVFFQQHFFLAQQVHTVHLSAKYLSYFIHSTLFANIQVHQCHKIQIFWVKLGIFKKMYSKLRDTIKILWTGINLHINNKLARSDTRPVFALSIPMFRQKVWNITVVLHNL